MEEALGKPSRRQRLKGWFKGDSKKDVSSKSSASSASTSNYEDNRPRSSGQKPRDATLHSSAPSHPLKGSKPTPNASNSSATTDENRDVDLDTARDHLWRRAFEKLRADNAELVDVYEVLMKDDAGIDQSANIFTKKSISAVVAKQKTRMESRQWTYSWFGKTQKVRDSAESILTTVNKVSGIVSAGMSAAPPYVSLPWGMATSLVAFVMSDLEAVNSAIDGLKEVTSILASFSHAECEFLNNKLTRNDFEEIVLDLYVAILDYQARAAQYFARSTLKRFGINTLTAQSWPDAVGKVRNHERITHAPIIALGTRLNQSGFHSVEEMLGQGIRLMKQVNHAIEAERSQKERIQNWISPINHMQDHLEVRNIIGDEYLESGQWLLDDQDQFRPWIESSNDILFLQGVVGSGKTSLTSIVTQSLLCRGKTAFFYCSHNALPQDPTRTIHDETANIFRSILAQCAVHVDGTISREIQTIFERSDRKSAGGCDMTLGVTVSTLKDVLEEYGEEQITFVFDALDECKDQEEFMACLASLTKSKAKLRVFVSTRFGANIADHFVRSRSLNVGTRNSRDIQGYIESEVSKRGGRMSSGQAERLKKALSEHSDGV